MYRSSARAIAILFILFFCFTGYIYGKDKPVTLELTYPAGKSPKVFTEGWVFGAKCIADGKDISDSVNWSGSGVFHPSVGAISRPVFHVPGENTITLSVIVEGNTTEKTFKITAVSPANYAAIGDQSHCPSDSHGCTACPHITLGPIITGSQTVTVNNKPAARVGDEGIAAACCGPNTFVIAEGDPSVLIDGKPAARVGDKTNHCGGVGKIISSFTLMESDYYALFQLTIPAIKENIKPERGDNESKEAWKQRKHAVYEKLTYDDFKFDEMPVEKSPFLIHVSDQAKTIYLKDNFTEQSKWAVKIESSFYNKEKGTGKFKGTLLLTLINTFDNRDALFATYPALVEKKKLTIYEFTDNDGKATVQDEKSRTVVGQITPGWSEKDKRDSVQLIKAFMLWFDCFIAHVVYDYGEDEKIASFRKFRDLVLRRTDSGAHLVRLYYEYGPYYAHLLKNRPKLTAGIRIWLDMFAAVLNKVDMHDKNISRQVDRAIYLIDKIVSIYYEEGAVAGPGRLTRMLVPLLWEKTEKNN